MKTYILYITAGLLLFFAPIQGLLLAVGISIVLDTFTGIFKSIKLNGLKSIQSRKLSNIISKMLLYEITILVLFIIDRYVLNEFLLTQFSIPFMITKLASIVFIFIEMVSVKENIEEALNIDVWKLLKKLLNRAKEIKGDIDEIK